jgi:single-strand DNA-binding protein
MSLNRASIIGFLGRDPELRSLSSSQAVTHLSVATDENFKDDSGERQHRAEWHNVVVFGKLAETCAKYLKKGRQIYVEGRLHTREWESDKQKHQRTEIVASRVQFLGSPVKDEPEGGENGDAA